MGGRGGGPSGDVADQAFCLKSAPECNVVQIRNISANSDETRIGTTCTFREIKMSVMNEQTIKQTRVIAISPDRGSEIFNKIFNKNNEDDVISMVLSS